jgi:phosphoglycolate phosphatase-like HAD superfamily hydrolase
VSGGEVEREPPAGGHRAGIRRLCPDVGGEGGREPPAVLFDLDGTLLWLEVDIDAARQALSDLFRPWGFELPFRPILPRIREAAALAATRGGDESALARAGLEVLDGVEVRAARTARARHGAPELVAALAARGARLGLVTDNGRACVAVALRAAGIDPAVFGAISTRDDVARPKPDPAGIVAVAGVLAGEGGARVLWYVGDHPRDVQAARAAAEAVGSIRVAVVKGGLGDAAELERAGADASIEDLEALPAILGLSAPG